MTAIAPTPLSTGTRFALRRLYSARSAFAIIWAAVFAATSSTPLQGIALALLPAYPAFDVVAAGVDVRTSKDLDRSRVGLYVNVVLSALAATCLAVAGDDVRAVLLVWGAWAITTGAVQLTVGAVRRRLGGQTPIMLSGAISVLAGAGFAASSGGAGSVTSLAGYAVLGGIFFLAPALRLGRSARPVAGVVD